jgi:hypothetical protein
MLVALAGSVARAESDTRIAVFEGVPIEWSATAGPAAAEIDGVERRSGGQSVVRTIDLPEAPANQRDARRVIATVEVEPVLVESGGKARPGDPWTRLGSVEVILPDKTGASPRVAEIMRFITGFGGPATYRADVTALAPLLSGRSTLSLSISTYARPAWRASLTLTYSDEGVGVRRPALAAPLFHELNVTSEANSASAVVTIPAGLERPRLRLITSGHATDGGPGDEFTSRTHVLRIDGREVARWRPWSEQGGALRPGNPSSGRHAIDGRELWSSDLDRAGWHPGLMVEPLMIPLPELTPGRHEIDLEILGIRPSEKRGVRTEHGYWRVSGIVVADEPWPIVPATRATDQPAAPPGGSGERKPDPQPRRGS